MKKIIFSTFAILALSSSVMASNSKSFVSKKQKKVKIVMIDCVDRYHATYYTVTHLMELGPGIGSIIADLEYNQCMAGN